MVRVGQCEEFLSDVCKFIYCLRHAICPLCELGEMECEQALSTLFHVLFTMARLMVCGRGRGEADPARSLRSTHRRRV